MTNFVLFLFGFADIVKVAANTKSPSKTNPPYDYGEALTKVLLFFDSMVSVLILTLTLGTRIMETRFYSQHSCSLHLL